MIAGTKSNGFQVNKLKAGMVGGGPGSFIGDVHRKAAKFDGRTEFVAGAFSRTYDKSLQTGTDLGIEEERIYENFQKMAGAESSREDGIDFVSIVVPNKFHYPVAKAFLEKGVHVICDKPLTVTVDEAEELKELTKKSDLLFGVTYVYSGYPMVKQAKKLVHDGMLGQIRVVQGEYPQEWLSQSVEEKGNKQAEWRTDPDISGRSNCVGDIGSHVENTVSYVTGLKIDRLLAKLDCFGQGRQLDDNAAAILEFNNGASGSFWCSQVAVGHDNGLKIRVYGTKGSLGWNQEDPDHLRLSLIDKPSQILSRGRDEFHQEAESMVRLPAGHPEGFYEAFSNIYKNFINALIDYKNGKNVKPVEYDFPSVNEGLQGVKFINACVDSSLDGSSWKELS